MTNMPYVYTVSAMYPDVSHTLRSISLYSWLQSIHQQSAVMVLWEKEKLAVGYNFSSYLTDETVGNA